VKPSGIHPCPCGRRRHGKPLHVDACCGPALAGTPATDAESLMRSRYTAFVRGDVAYLLATWHPDRRPPVLELDAGTKWLGLEVRDHRATGEDAAQVEFVARSRQGGRGHRLHERSRFVRLKGRWYYLDGDML
jgi:SEC-C motif-containing protein